MPAAAANLQSGSISGLLEMPHQPTAALDEHVNWCSAHGLLVEATAMASA